MNFLSTQVGGFSELKDSTSVQFFSSMTNPVTFCALIDTAAADDVNITLLTVFVFVQAFSTFTTPWIAGLIMSVCREKENGKKKYLQLKIKQLHFDAHKTRNTYTPNTLYLWIIR